MTYNRDYYLKNATKIKQQQKAYRERWPERRRTKWQRDVARLAGKDKAVIKICTIHGLTEFVLYANSSGYKCKQCENARVRETRASLKSRIVEISGGSCVICGYNKCYRSLQFHHLDPAKKRFNVSSARLVRNFNEVLEEIKECVLVCANCHGEIEDGLISPSFLKEITDGKQEALCESAEQDISRAAS